MAGTVALAAVDKEIQYVFVWFVMAFPILLVTLFFATLNFNPKVLYAPSDFKDEENFLSTLIGTKNVSVGLDAMLKQLEESEHNIRFKVVWDGEQANFAETVINQFKEIEQKAVSVHQIAERLNSTLQQISLPALTKPQEKQRKTG